MASIHWQQKQKASSAREALLAVRLGVHGYPMIPVYTKVIASALAWEKEQVLFHAQTRLARTPWEKLWLNLLGLA